MSERIEIYMVAAMCLFAAIVGGVIGHCRAVGDRQLMGFAYESGQEAYWDMRSRMEGCADCLTPPIE